MLLLLVFFRFTRGKKTTTSHLHALHLYLYRSDCKTKSVPCFVRSVVLYTLILIAFVCAELGAFELARTVQENTLLRDRQQPLA